ncbi:MAG TPA: helix-turn-helix domain-containing protein [Pirellulales bacterium]|nr:helix-turn-helix domain-containing protein [Pirellulales bacterium]
MTATLTAGSPPADPEPALGDVHAVATRLDCSTRHVRRLADAGLMPAPIRLGSLLRWRLADIDAWIQGGCKRVR